MADNTSRDEPVNHGKRDGETYFAIGLYIFVIGLPVVFGTVFSLDTPRAAIVNFIAGMVLVLGGLLGMYYGRALKKRNPDKLKP
ncbi:MAG: hypothetical protein HYV27_24685 [Candidatus Hydrogenedentes bacterium]|nr:hypothetical protein [Candidatus Hydrogenedentota bacterium]